MVPPAAPAESAAPPSPNPQAFSAFDSIAAAIEELYRASQS
jgi:hypothetical protein